MWTAVSSAVIVEYICYVMLCYETATELTHEKAETIIDLSVLEAASRESGAAKYQYSLRNS